MDKEAHDFLVEMARSLDDALQRLALEEHRITSLLGEPRTEELRSYCAHEFEYHEEEAFRLNLDYLDRSLISIWNRQLRMKENRLLSGRTLMREEIYIPKEPGSTEPG